MGRWRAGWWMWERWMEEEGWEHTVARARQGRVGAWMGECGCRDLTFWGSGGEAGFPGWLGRVAGFPSFSRMVRREERPVGQLRMSHLV